MIDLQPLLPWLEKASEATDVVCAPLTARLAALLDQQTQAWPGGKAIPSSWYVMLYGPTELQSRLGPDGHPPKGNVLPPVPYPRRMFAGRRVEFPGDLRIGDEVRRVSRVTAITPKRERSGPMCFVTLRHELHTERGLAVIEEQDVVYRPEIGQAADTSKPPAPDAAPAPRQPAAFTATLVPETTLLFRYSAITNNTHRIHYDVTYTREIEGYPDLVVNGGLSTLLLWEFAEQSAGAKLTRSSTRNLFPLFVGRPLTLNVSAAQGGKSSAWVADSTGKIAIEAELEFA